MKHALLFRDNEEPILVSADDVKEGKYDRYDEYVDPEYEFKVEYVKGAKHGGGPYFRLYYSYEEYKRLYPERADRYQIVADMRRYEESEWHRNWKANVSDFCHIEKTIQNKERRQWKIADAYYADTKTCIEFQHSYISFHFEEKNEFYRALSLKTVWLYDLSHSNIHPRDDGSIDILEDNARGFFRISENADNLRDNFVYIQVKPGKIYRVTELERRETSNSLKSTIRYFWPSEIFDKREFVAAIRNNSFKRYEDILADREKVKRRRQEQKTERYARELVVEGIKRAKKPAIGYEEWENELHRQVEEEERRRREQEAERSRKLAEDPLDTGILMQRAEEVLEAERKARVEAERKAAAEAVRQKIQYANYEQADEFVIIDGQRWVLCTRCNQPRKEEDMPMIGFNPARNPNKGVCRDCLKING